MGDMNIKRKLNQYVEEMDIPPAGRVLPEDAHPAQDKGKKQRRSRKPFYIGMAGTAAAACLAAVIVLQPWQGSSMHDDGTIDPAVERADNAMSADGKIDGFSVSGADKPTSALEYGDGVIHGEEADAENGWIAGEKSDGAALEEVPADAVAGEDIGADRDVMDGIDGEPADQLSAGTLTGGEIRDLKNWDNWLRVFSFSEEYMGQWNMVLNRRAVVYVHNGDMPLRNIHVRLMQEDEVLYEAVTDTAGYAYLFYQYVSGSQQSPTAVCVQAADDHWQSFDYSPDTANEQVLDVALSQENQAVKVDLMYVVDTTGSMGDELEYLKAEIQDVIERAEEQTGAQIRTSVNFYRDEDDAYVVRYYDFREDAAEVAALVAEQTADGGGDQPEAVHTALRNALHEHDWSEDSTVKLMFLVLDAPPHEDEEVRKEILELTEDAAAMGVRIIPVAASGADDAAQQLFRGMAVMTGGTFIFLDDNSGVGGSHTVTVQPQEYKSEYLNEMMIRIIGEYCGITVETQEVKPAGDYCDHN